MSPRDGDTATELRAQRTWDRARRVLDSRDGGKLAHAAQQALSSADAAELGVLAEELPSYLQSRGLPTD
jgi:hypothetical protein